MNPAAPNVRRDGHCKPSFRRRSSIFTSSSRNTEVDEERYRVLTGRQNPVAMGKKLQMIYGSIVAEKLPSEMLDLLSTLDKQSVES